MTQPAFDSPTDLIGTDSSTVVSQREAGIQLRLFPAGAPRGADIEVDLRDSDALTGMYYIG